MVEELIDSTRVRASRTGTPNRHAASAVKGWVVRSSFDPNPPPTAVGMIRTASSGRAMIRASASRFMKGACVQHCTSIRSP